MIVHYDETGFIYHTQSDPFDPEALANVLVMSPRCKHLQAQATPAVALVGQDGEMLIDEETGQARMHIPGYVEPDCSIMTHYVDVATDEIVDRPRIEPLVKTEIKADGKDFIPISGLPDPTTVYVDDEPYVIEGGRLDFASDAPGTYRLRIGWPCQDWTAEIVAT
jgi:hypothetical protein